MNPIRIPRLFCPKLKPVTQNIQKKQKKTLQKIFEP